MNIRLIINGYDKQAELLRRKISERIPAEFTVTGRLSIALTVDPAIGAPESYEIRAEGDVYTVTGTDELGLYHGIGKFLHTAKWTDEDFVPNPPKGVIEPDCSFRVMYFSVHNYNWYHLAPTEELESYLEDMILWGYNGIHCIVPVMNITELGDEVFRDGVERARRLFTLARKVGLKVSLGINPNQGLLGSPHEFDAKQDAIRWKNGRNLCGSNPAAVEHLREIWRAKFERFTDIGIDYIITWPYDEGGCCCDECWPWGAKKFCDLSLAVREEARKYFPDVKMIACTWCFDVLLREGETEHHEYDGFYKRLDGGDMSCFDYIMVDSHTEYPEYVLTHDAVKPIVNFPEISMWGLYPWGGFGANPLPKRFQAIWDSSKQVLMGGMPYSEGIYEDILKIQFAGYYWDKNRNYKDILSEYINYEYRSSDFDKIIEMMELIEENHVAVDEKRAPNLGAAKRAKEIAEEINEKLTPKARACWRWRILYIRPILDLKRYEFYAAKGLAGEDGKFLMKRRSGHFLKKDAEAQAMMRELSELYCCVDYNGQNRWTHPPVDGGAPEDACSIIFDD